MDFEKEIKKIKERNKKVELDKEWETSWTRKLCIMLLTYVVVVLYSFTINKISIITVFIFVSETWHEQEEPDS